MSAESGPTETLSAEAVQQLLENRRKFLAFLRRRVGSAEEAEDILQAAFVRGLEKGDSLREESSAVAWFYRLLRNAVIDHYRRQAHKQRALEEFVRELETHEEPADATRNEICGCISGILATIKPEYRQAIQSVDLEEQSLAQLAGSAGISEGNAGVRVHRARQALRRQVRTACGMCAEHGCLDCTCAGKSHH